jgi:hypothetical protein
VIYELLCFVGSIYKTKFSAVAILRQKSKYSLSSAEDLFFVLGKHKKTNQKTAFKTMKYRLKGSSY